MVTLLALLLLVLPYYHCYRTLAMQREIIVCLPCRTPGPRQLHSCRGRNFSKHCFRASIADKPHSRPRNFGRQ